MSKGNVRFLAEELIKVIDGDTHEFAHSATCKLRKLAEWGEGSVDYAALAQSTSTMISAFGIGEGKEVTDIGDLLMAARALSVVDLWRDSAALYAQAVGAMIRKAAADDRVVAEITFYRAVPSLIEAALTEEDVKKWWAFRGGNSVEEVTTEDSATTSPEKEVEEDFGKAFIFTQKEVKQILSQDTFVFRRLVKLGRLKWNRLKKHNFPLALSRNKLNDEDLGLFLENCPVGLAGNTVWVRETFCVDKNGRTLYKADGFEKQGDLGQWLSPAAMTKDRTRLRILITSVTVEKLGEFDPTRNPIQLAEAPTQASYFKRWEAATRKEFNPKTWVYRVEGKLIK